MSTPGEPVDYSAYQQPGPSPYPPAPQGDPYDVQSPLPANALAIWALVVGILAVLVAVTVVGASVSALIGVVGLVLAILALVRAQRIPPQSPKRRLGMSWTALALSVVAIVASIVFYVGVTMLLQNIGATDCLVLPELEQRESCLREAFESNAA